MSGAEFRLWVHGSPYGGQDVVGEQYHQSGVRRAIRRFRPDSTGRLWGTVALVPEPDNPHDPHAIAVFSERDLLGYLPRGECARWLPVVGRVAGAGLLTTTRATIWTGGSVPQVYLHLPEPELSLPANEPPAAPHTLLPDGPTVQVVKEEQHFDVLRDHVPAGGKGRLTLTLHPVDVAGARTATQVIEVRLDGTRVGELSRTMSPRFLPVVEHNLARGLETAVRATITGSAISAALTLQAAQSHELDDAALHGPAVPVPSLRPRGDAPEPRPAAAPEPPVAPEPPAAPHPPAAPAPPEPVAPPRPGFAATQPPVPAGTPGPSARPAGAPWWKKLLAGTSIAFGVLFVIAALGSLNTPVPAIGIALAAIGAGLPGAWWFAAESRDSRARSAALETGRSNADLKKLLGPENATYTDSLEEAPEPDLVRRRWLLVSVVSILLVVVGVTLSPAPDETGTPPDAPTSEVG